MTSSHRVIFALLVLAAGTDGALAQPSAARDPQRGNADAESAVRLPAIDTIFVGPDTVWFCDSRAERLIAGYYFLRQSAEWRRIDRSTVAACPVRARVPRADTIRGADYLVTRQDSSIWDPLLQRRSQFPYLRVVDDRYQRTTTLLPNWSASTIRGYADRYGPAAVSDFATVGAATASDTMLWIGLRGGAPEDAGTVGGLYRVHRPSGAYTLLLFPQIEGLTISGLVTRGRWLWVGTTGRPWSNRRGVSGLVRYDNIAKDWHAYDPNENPLSDRFIQTIAADDRVFAVATRTGLAVAALPEDSLAPVPRPSRDEVLASWDIRKFQPAFVRDSLVFDLVPRSASSLAADAERLSFAMDMAPRGQERALFAALARVPVESLSVWRRSPPDHERLGAMIADQAVVPGLLATRPWSPAALFLASGVIGALGAKAPEPARAALLSEFTILDQPTTTAKTRDMYRGVLGRALTYVGDSTAVVWARGVLQRATKDRAGEVFINIVPERHGEQLSAAASIVAAGRDRAGLGLLIAAVPVADIREQVAFAAALVRYDDPNAWRALVAFGKARSLHPAFALRAMTPAVMRDSSIATIVMQMIHDALREDTRNPDFRSVVLTAVVNLRLCTLAPDLVEMLYRSPPFYGDMVAAQTIRTLVNLYGESDAPVYDGYSPSLHVVQWWKQRTARSGADTCVPADVGRAAELKWTARLAEWQQLRKAP